MLFCSINWPAKVVIIADITKCARYQFLIPNFSFQIPNYQFPLSRWSIRAVTSLMFTLPS